MRGEKTAAADGGAWREGARLTDGKLLGVCFANAREGWTVSDMDIVHPGDGGETRRRVWEDREAGTGGIAFATDDLGLAAGIAYPPGPRADRPHVAGWCTNAGVRHNAEFGRLGTRLLDGRRTDDWGGGGPWMLSTRVGGVRWTVEEASAVCPGKEAGGRCTCVVASA